MQQPPESKRMKPVTGSAMLNFVYWVGMYYPSLLDLQHLSQSALLRLIYEFEQSRSDIEPRTMEAWLEGIADMHNGANTYKAAQKALRLLK